MMFLNPATLRPSMRLVYRKELSSKKDNTTFVKGHRKKRLCTSFSLNANSINTEKRYTFSDSYHLPNFLDVQKKSFQMFIKKGLIQEFNACDLSVQSMLRSPSDRKHCFDRLLIDFVFYPEYYRLKPPKLNIKQAMLARKTYNSELYIPIQLIDYKNNRFLFDWFCVATVPLMTSNGHFIINGLPRIIMSQIVRSPGVYFKKIYRSDQKNYYYTADFIAQRGSWLRLEADTKRGDVWVKLKSTPKIPLLTFLRGFELSLSLFNNYYDTAHYDKFEKPKRIKKPEDLKTNRRGYTKKGLNYYQEAKKKSAQEKINVKFADLHRFHLLDDDDTLANKEFFDHFPNHLLYLLTKLNNISPRLSQRFLPLSPIVQKKPDRKLPLFDIEQVKEIKEDQETLLNDVAIVKSLMLNFGVARQRLVWSTMREDLHFFLMSKFLNKRTYNLSSSGRARINQTLGLKVPLDHTVLTNQDLLFACFYLLECVEGTKEVSDIDHLKNRKIKPVGDLLQTQVAVGLTRLQKTIFENLAILGEKNEGKHFLKLWVNHEMFPENKSSTAQFKKYLFNLINAKPINSAFQDFFGTNPLSQMLDQTNPLAEMTHKRRLSSLGMGGVSRQNAGMDIRGIHPTHYGRICPIETPEGQNAGLVNSFTIYAQLNELGFIQTPFYETYKGFVLREKGPKLFLADQEGDARIAPGDIYINPFNFLPPKVQLPSRQIKTFQRVNRSDIHYMALNPLQMISIATSLIPFLEHDDGNRALMGSNMQRQAVPTLKPTLPIVGTGLESKIVSDINHGLRAKESGFISYVDSKNICIYSPLVNSSFDSNAFIPQTDPSLMPNRQNKRMKNLVNFKEGVARKVDLKKDQGSFSLPMLRSQKLNKMRLQVVNSIIKHCQLKGFGFNVISKKGEKHYLSFLNRLQLQRLFRTSFCNDSLSVSFILSLILKQKEYSVETKRFVYLNNYFTSLLTRATWTKKRSFLNSAYTSLNDYFGLRSSVSFNNKIIHQKLDRHSTSKSTFHLTESCSPFNQLVLVNMTKTRPFLPTQILFKKEKTSDLYSTLNKKLISFCEPMSNEWINQTDSSILFLRHSTRSIKLNKIKQRFFPSLNKFSYLAPANLVMYQTFIAQLEKVDVTNTNFSNFNPSIYTKSLIKCNQVDDSIAATSYLNHDQAFGLSFPTLQKELFYQKLLIKPTKKSICTDLNTVSYLPLSNIRENKVPFNETFSSPNNLILAGSSLRLKTYTLDSIARSNQDTYLFHRPTVQPGQWVEKGEILADNSASSKGELAIGQNLLVGYTPWEGYNFEDAVLLSERVLSQELFSSIHVERYEVDVRDTPYGIEEITNNLPIDEGDLSYLNDQGIVKVGTWVNEGDVLVGKKAPIKTSKKEDLSNYEQLLYAILGKKRQKFRDTSLRVPPNVHGRVVHVEVIETIDDFRKVALMEAEAKKAKAKKARQQRSETKKIQKQKKPSIQAQMKLSHEKLAKLTHVQTTKVLRQRKKRFASVETNNLKFNFEFYKQKPISEVIAQPSDFSYPLILQKEQENIKNKSVKKNNDYVCHSPVYSILSLNNLMQLSSKTKRLRNKNKIKKNSQKPFFKETETAKPVPHKSILKKSLLKKLDLTDLPSKRPKKVNIYIAEKRQLQVGDKIAGRHGNKGIISNLLPQQDMPYLPDGTPLDLVLNPLGVPSRMNVGQIFECLLGLAGSYLHQTYKIQPFDELYGCEASRSLVYSKLYEARIKTKQNWLFDPNFPGKVRLFDGRTGQCFEQPVTVGRAYILKLIHLVDEKIHARSLGPYSLVTQQPLRGRSKKGGQRVGEMEVWALEGFGAAYILQELLTVKSDDVYGRNALLTRLINREGLKFGTPESFRVLLRELQSLCVDISIYSEPKKLLPQSPLIL